MTECKKKKISFIFIIVIHRTTFRSDTLNFLTLTSAKKIFNTKIFNRFSVLKIKISGNYTHVEILTGNS